MKRRKKKAKGPRINFCEVPTTELVEIDDLDSPYPELRNRFVKVCPRIPASKRQFFDGATVAAEIRSQGALSVVLAPVIIADGVTSTKKPEASQTPHRAAKEWFHELKIKRVEKQACFDLLSRFMEEEGM
jgi:hypothetical protein